MNATINITVLYELKPPTKTIKESDHTIVGAVIVVDCQELLH